VLSLALPVLVALVVAVAEYVGLRLLQHSLVSALLCKPEFPLARKLVPASAALLAFLTARAMVAAAHIHSGFAEVLFAIAILWTIAYLTVRSIWVLTQLLLQRFDIESVDNLRERRIRTQLHFLEKLGYVTVMFLAVGGTLLLFEPARHYGQSLLASAGVVGVIVGFAAQKPLGNLLAGFQIALTQPLRIEDAVVVEGEFGWVEEINLTYVVIRVWDRRRLIMPITYFVDKPFENWTRKTSHIIGVVLLEVSHKVQLDKLEAELFRLLDGTPLWDGDVRVLQMIDAGTRSVTLRALMTAKDSPTSWDLRCLVRRGLIEYLRDVDPAALPVVRVDRLHELPVEAGGKLLAAPPTLVLSRQR
jgi:small-conductance mechanosensitive channel